MMCDLPPSYEDVVNNFELLPRYDNIVISNRNIVQSNDDFSYRNIPLSSITFPHATSDKNYIDNHLEKPTLFCKCGYCRHYRKYSLCMFFRMVSRKKLDKLKTGAFADKIYNSNPFISFEGAIRLAINRCYGIPINPSWC